MSERIRELDDSTVARIAAGEVVDRPASAVKELVENSLDAGASRIAVSIEEGGTAGIRVVDDGHGMTRADLRAAVREHTTSKIDDLADLEAGLETLGFRGEALHAIAAVSHLAIESRTPDADTGVRLEAVGGEVRSVESTGCPVGTVVEVEELFFNTPARRKFLKSTPTEFGHINRVVTRYALANPGVAVSLTHDGREVFATAGQGDLEAAIMAVYGREVAEAMVPVGDEKLPPGPLRGVSGRVSHPETTRSSREYIATFVNGRAVRSSVVRDGIMAAYGRQLAGGRYPFVVLFLSMDPESLDVNVHPRKREVRFEDEEGLRSQVEAAVEGALLEAGLVRSGAPRGRSAPAETSVRPGPGRDGDDEGSNRSRPDRGHAHASGGDRGHTRPEGSGAITPARTQRTLAGGVVDDAPDLGSLPSLRVLGQLDDTYVVCEGPDGLVLVDQHAADERIHYERLRDALAETPDVQELASPVALELTAAEAAAFERVVATLERLGFRAETRGDRTVAVRGVPAVLGEALDPERLRDVLAEVLEGRGPADRPAAELATDVLADLACHPAITANTALTEGSIVTVLERLDACENPYACPHGRPVVIEIDEGEIEERFERDYPGHAG